MQSQHQTRSVEWLLAFLMVAWGAGLMLPGNTMELQHYRHLAALAPEPVWAAWSMSIGIARLAALYINGSWSRSPLIRAGGAALGVIWWLILGYLLYTGRAGGPLPAALMWYPVFCGFELYSAWRGARDSYHSGALKKWQSLAIR